jgi:hypothetical protein
LCSANHSTPLSRNRGYIVYETAMLLFLSLERNITFFRCFPHNLSPISSQRNTMVFGILFSGGLRISPLAREAAIYCTCRFWRCTSNVSSEHAGTMDLSYTGYGTGKFPRPTDGSASGAPFKETLMTYISHLSFILALSTTCT